ncbi:FMN-binding protein [Anaerosporobacter sp.]|uniref:FMN-binding protein n=1 Tax=Anaerosporobacter sp. TaxID=1872529 RepID=UPI00286FA9A7|nr:FMN-binding protein [Anaerosporobacter sp.]
MKHRRYVFLIVLIVTFASVMTGCGSKKMKDGFYTAEMAEFSKGWKEYVCILVNDGVIVSVEYDAKDQSGFIKAWDNEYMRNMNGIKGTYPNRYVRELAGQLITDQNADSIDVVSGASHSSSTFEQLAMAVIEQAKKGDTSKVIVDTE